jgi:hypothetical protein
MQMCMSHGLLIKAHQTYNNYNRYKQKTPIIATMVYFSKFGDSVHFPI